MAKRSATPNLKPSQTPSGKRQPQKARQRKARPADNPVAALRRTHLAAFFDDLGHSFFGPNWQANSANQEKLKSLLADALDQRLLELREP